MVIRPYGTLFQGASKCSHTKSVFTVNKYPVMLKFYAKSHGMQSQGNYSCNIPTKKTVDIQTSCKEK
jgi:hypothetical protein